jgi:hypothetical protein
MSTSHKLNDLFDKEGKLISPQLPKEVKNYLIDIDGTITEDVPNEEPERMVTCEPFPDALETLNRWFDQGHIITFFTSRTVEHKEVTDAWLKKHGFKHHGVLYGKQEGVTIIGSTITSCELPSTKASLLIWFLRPRRWSCLRNDRFYR